jgi:hypothetical protein
MQMNIDERLAKYLQRDFSLEQAQILVLMEEAAIALFRRLARTLCVVQRCDARAFSQQSTAIERSRPACSARFAP